MHADVGEIRQAVVYGDDGRRDVFEDADRARAALASLRSVALVSRRNVTDDGGRVRIDAASAGDTFGLCEGERFAAQPSGAFCSGMLVEPDLVLTAAHCTAYLPCSAWSAVRGYQMARDASLRELTASNVAGCRGVAMDSDPEVDLAWVRLDRALLDAPPVAARAAPLSEGDPLVLVGNALGLPTKIDAGGVVTDAAPADYLSAALDNFVGGSGSAVFDGEGKAVGVATSGAQDFVEEPSGCRTVRQRAPSEGVEKVFRLERARDIPLSDLPARVPPAEVREPSCSVAAPATSGAWSWRGFAAALALALAWLRAQSRSLVRSARAASCEAGSTERRDSSSRRCTFARRMRL